MLKTFQVFTSNRKEGYEVTFMLVIILVNNKAKKRYYKIN